MASNQPVPDSIQANDTGAVLDILDKLFDTGKKQAIAEGKRIEFFEGKRRMKDGTLKRTGHQYWQWRWKDTDTGKRPTKYGGEISTVPEIYQYRRRQYEARIASRGSESLADALLRPALSKVGGGDTGSE